MWFLELKRIVARGERVSGHRTSVVSKNLDTGLAIRYGLRHDVDMSDIEPYRDEISDLSDTDRRARLVELERVVEEGVRAFVQAGRALRSIRDEKLYEPEYPDFRAYCEGRWWRSHAYRLVDAATVVELAGERAEIIRNESQATALTPLIRQHPEPEQAVQRVLSVVTNSDTKPTAATIRDTVSDELSLPAGLPANEAREVLTRYADLRRTHGDDVSPARMERVLNNRVGRVRRERESNERRAAMVAAGGDGRVGEVELVLSDFREMDIAPGTVDMMIADPPYSRDSIDLYRDLGAFAERVLTDTGMLIVYTGNSNQMAFVRAIESSIPWWWQIVVGQRERQTAYGRGFIVDFKPLHLFRKSPTPVRGRMLPSTIEGGGADKRYHPWGQAESEALWVVENLSEPGDLVCDPMAGGGTTAVAAYRLGRRCIGSEIDPATYAVALDRLRAEQQQ